MSLAAQLDAAIKAVCPIDGVSIGRTGDKSTWSIGFTKEATEQQRLAAQAVLEAFEPVVQTASRDAAIDALLAQKALEPDAPQEIKDYANTKG